MQPYQTHRMRWSWPVARIAGIQVSVHLTFFLLLLWIALTVWRQTQAINAVIQGVAFVLALFACVVMHEFGHALTARRFGIQTRGITLLPIGGVAQLERMPDDPREEILVALAGPAVNVVIASVLYLLLSGSGFSPAELEQNPQLLFSSEQAFAYNIMVINVVLAIFNLLPAFPMDGGRVLRAALALIMPHHEATRRAAGVGQMLAMLMFVMGLLYNPILMLISVFIWLGAAGEAGAEAIQHALHKVKARDVMIERFTCLSTSDSLQRAVDLLMHRGQRDFPVVLPDGQPRLLDQALLVSALNQYPADTTLAELELPPLLLVRPDDRADELFQALQQSGQEAAGVMEAGQLTGIIPLSGLTTWIQLHQGPGGA